MSVVCVIIFFALVAVMPIYCNRENEAEYLAAYAAENAAYLSARDEEAVGDLVDTDVIADKEGLLDPEAPEWDAALEDEPADPDEPVFVFDRSKMLICYPKATPRPSASMIHSETYNTLEVHGDFEGAEDDVAALERMLDSFSGNISLIAYSLDGSRSLCYNTDYRYQSHCTIKASFIYSICQYMDANAFDDETVLIYKERNALPGSGTVQNNPFGTGFTVRDLISRCLTISDNAAYSMLVDFFGNEIRNTYMDMIGCESLKTNGLWCSRVSPEDYVVLWDEIYNYLRTGSHFAKLMKQSCTNTPFSYARPVNGLEYSHKSGDSFDETESHDIVLVWDDVPYVLAIFTRASSEDVSNPSIESIAYIVNENIF